MARTIGVVTVARSDYGHLVPLLRGAPRSRRCRAALRRGRAPRRRASDATVSAIEADGWPIAARIETTGASDAAVDVAAGTGRGRGRVRPRLRGRPARPDRAAGGSREMLAAAVAALPLTLPVAHLHGGEVTEGAIDEQARHAITKLAHLHFPAAEPYARRIRQMGEEPRRVHCWARPGSIGSPARRDAARGAGAPDRAAVAPADPAGDVPSGDPRAGRGGPRTARSWPAPSRWWTATWSSRIRAPTRRTRP